MLNTLVLRDGRVIDPASGFDGVADVVITDGRISAVGPDAGRDWSGERGESDVEVVDCRGMLVTPGLIDLHAHVFPGLGDFCVEPDRAGVRTGVPVVVDAGYLPHSISTDLNIYNVDVPVGSLPETMSKIWTLGVPLADVVAMATTGPARSIGRSDELGALTAGRAAEVSVLRIDDEPAELSDGHETIVAERRLVPVGCVRGGRWLPAEAEAPVPA
jgi:predicted amidohydrolase